MSISPCSKRSRSYGLDHKAPLIASLANALPPPHRFLPRRELAAEIEWAKNRMIPPGDYLEQIGEHEPPIPADLMLRVYQGTSDGMQWPRSVTGPKRPPK